MNRIAHRIISPIALSALQFDLAQHEQQAFLGSPETIQLHV